MKKLLCVILSAVMLLSGQLATLAASNWDAYWENYLENGNGLYIAPGADDTEMYFSWIGGKDGVKPTVKVSESADMSNPKTFTGEIAVSEYASRSNHVVATGLTPGKTYYYVCCDGTTDTSVRSFATVGEGESFSALYVSDIHLTGQDYDDTQLSATAKEWDKVLNEVTSKHNISLILSGGDQATEGRECEYFAMCSPEEVKQIPFATAIGNHDVKRYTYDTTAHYPNTKDFNLSKSLIHGDYYFVKGNALFLVIDSTNSSSADHYNFVKKAVKANPDAKWRIMMFHHDLFGGHIESREGENMLLRMLFTPIIDKFEIDLCLSGHSHCYSQSHVIYKRNVTEKLTANDSIVDPKGTVYLVSGTLHEDWTDPNADPDDVKEPQTTFDSDRKSEFVATDCLTNEHSIYNTLDFTEDTLTVKSYFSGEDEPFNSLEITKTSQKGGHPKNLAPIWFVIGKYIGTIYNIINNISRKIEIADRY